MRKIMMGALAGTVLMATVPVAAEQLTIEEGQAIVKPFYDLFSLQGSEAAARANISPDWKSYYSNTGYKNLDDTMKAVAGAFPKILPDMKWTQDDISVTTENEVVVRGTLSGTPAGDTFFGQPVNGKTFETMTLDIHTIEDGKIVKTYHIEDWFRALGQLKPQEK
ncbi:SnoaL-like polyketide cyclase [Grimontia celer]|uniref:SnoaL-like polyketide cyclase n=1 Tax=Grimontia celer TaxID=1796497 RepID=A0A128F8Z2_9GAMM|nr:ester cyclase [Grimontia celer]CZF82970.1 SnoaL-like polyketide cyclase [Grimontia celer]